MRFAYLIMAHNSFELLKELIRALDSQENDLYIHFDAKLHEVDTSQFLSIPQHSNLYFITNRVNVSWARISIVEATLNLLEASVDKGYDYYHLLSGVDFPIKSNRYILDFFTKNNGKEFVGFDNKNSYNKCLNRIAYYHLIDGNKVRRSKMWSAINTGLLIAQKLLHIHHHYPIDKYCAGSAWFSITDSLAKELVEKREFFLTHYKYVYLPDEMFLQTFVKNDSKYYDSLYNKDDEYLGSLRYIDWKRGDPYVLQDEDYDDLLNSPYLYARKFSEKNIELIRKLSKAISLS